jgi:hypothetical protein
MEVYKSFYVSCMQGAGAFCNSDQRYQPESWPVVLASDLLTNWSSTGRLKRMSETEQHAAVIRQERFGPC